MPAGVYSPPKTSDAAKRKAMSMIQYNLEQSSLAKPQRKEAFLLTLEKYFPDVTKAAQFVGISPRNVWTWKAEDEVFSQQWDDIINKHMDSLEAFLYRFSRTKSGASYASSILRAYRPERWGDKREISVNITRDESILRQKAEQTLREVRAEYEVLPDAKSELGSTGDNGHNEASNAG